MLLFLCKKIEYIYYFFQFIKIKMSSISNKIIDIPLTYTQFIKEIKTNTFMKCLNNTHNHYGIQYDIGLNQDTQPFNPYSFGKGGLHFTTDEDIVHFTNYGVNIAIIELCQDALFSIVSKNPIKFKTNKFIIKEIIHQTEAFCKLAVQRYGNALQFVENQTEEICKLAVQSDGNALEYVQNQTEEICKLAVQNNGASLRFVKNQTEEMCKLAVMNHLYAIEYVQNQTEDICKLAVEHNAFVLTDVINQTEEICKLAVKKNGMMLKYVQNQTEEICKLAVQQNGKALKFVKNQTGEICHMAILNNSIALQYINIK